MSDPVQLDLFGERPDVAGPSHPASPQPLLPEQLSDEGLIAAIPDAMLADARALAALALGFEARTGIRPRLSIVPYNRIDCDGADPFRRGDPARFIERLVGHGVRPHLRYSGGADMAAACGQLSGRS